ncbi:MAG: hypothetical protein NT164_04200 [Verrucomicrobiae bacterium]|nr:hypothetical protein [Verrucomicrobiae bacterium]
MSLSAVSTTTPTNVNHHQNEPSTPVRNHHQQPSVENAKGRQTPTDAARSVQDTGDHTQVQKMDTQADVSNPLTSPQQSNHNQNVVRGGI